MEISIKINLGDREDSWAQHGKDRLASVMIRFVHSAERAPAFSVRHDRQVLTVIQSSGSQAHCVLSPLQSIGTLLENF